MAKVELREAYKDGLFWRSSNPSAKQLTSWLSRTHQLIWAAFKGEKKAEDFYKAEFSYLDSEANVPSGANATKEQLMIDGCLDYLQKLIGQVESLGPLKREPDFDGNEWVSKK